MTRRFDNSSLLANWFYCAGVGLEGIGLLSIGFWGCWFTRAYFLNHLRSLPQLLVATWCPGQSMLWRHIAFDRFAA